MITFGPPHLAFYPEANNQVVFNLSSVLEVGTRLFSLVPYTTEIGNLIIQNEPAFDTRYFEYLMNEGFIDFMRIFLHDYFGSNVYVCIEPEGNNFIKDAIALSIIKFAQLRYGVTINTVSEEDDLDYRKETDYTALGIQNFHADKERFFCLVGGEEFASYECS